MPENKDKPKFYGPLEFKSRPFFFEKERSGAKSNTIRKIGEHDKRREILVNIMKRGGYGLLGHRYKIKIINSKTKDSFERDITDVSTYEGWWIISW